MLVRLGNMQVPVPKNTWADQASSAGSVQYAGVLRHIHDILGHSRGITPATGYAGLAFKVVT